MAPNAMAYLAPIDLQEALKVLIRQRVGLEDRNEPNDDDVDSRDKWWLRGS